MITRRRYMGAKGETYETYDYLMCNASGGGYPHINTLYIPQTTTIMWMKYYPTRTATWIYGVRLNSSTRKAFASLVNAGPKLRVDRNNTYPDVFTPFALNTWHEVWWNTTRAEVDGYYSDYYNQLSESPNLPIFVGQMNNGGTPLTASNDGCLYGRVAIMDDSGNLYRHFIPCQLLRDTDQTWDGATHYAGECGMWDSVNDLFYGNANSTGSFSVGND